MSLNKRGTPLFISPQSNVLGEDQKALIKQCFARATKVQPTGEPLDWMSNPRPEKWKLNGRVVGFDWSWFGTSTNRITILSKNILYP
jgi:alpha-galactosidase